MKPLHIRKQSSQVFEQIFEFISEEDWTVKKETFGHQVATFFNGKKNEVFVLAQKTGNHFLIGVGKKNAPNFEFQEVAQKFTYDYRTKFLETNTLLITNGIEERAILNGLFLGTYEYGFSEKHTFYAANFALEVAHFSEKTVQNVAALCKGQFVAMEWLNKPANYKKVTQISAFLQEISIQHHLKYTCFNREQCEKLGLGAFLSVNQGSHQEAAFTILEYNGGNENSQTVGLVGKCVLFDTGGISIKPSDNMHYMKSDMGGATAVIGTLIAAAAMKLPINIIAILPITDNAVSNTAYLPSDVITAYNGKKIEVLNTDAEGRMTLADGLSYLVKNFKTDVLIDLATLTGSAVRMFGYTCGALFSNDCTLKNALEQAANETNQRLWNLPLWDIWADEIKSDVADYKNISSKPFGDCIVAAKFLEQFIENHPKWAHLDIAGVAFGNVAYAKEKAATGFGVQLLLQYIENVSQSFASFGTNA